MIALEFEIPLRDVAERHVRRPVRLPAPNLLLPLGQGLQDVLFGGPRRGGLALSLAVDRECVPKGDVPHALPERPLAGPFTPDDLRHASLLSSRILQCDGLLHKADQSTHMLLHFSFGILHIHI